MRTVAALFCLLGELLALTNGQSCGTDCPAGCCPLAHMYCCENNWQCGFQSDGSDCCTGSMNSPDCPDPSAEVQQLPKLKTLAGFVNANGRCSGTVCPAGCCPELDMFCCENNWQCGQTSDGSDCCTGSVNDNPDCPDVRVILILMKVGISTSTWFQNVPFCSLIPEQFLFLVYDHSFRCP